MKRNRSLALIAAAFLPLVWASAAGLQAAAPFWNSKDGLYRLSYASDLDPIRINRIHRWTLTLETSNGKPVSRAEIAVSGGMPVHDHGLPTEPRVTRELGDGRYLLEGVRFHMQGQWQLVISITAANGSDTVTVDLEI